VTTNKHLDVGRRLVILTADGLEHRYVANRICERFPVAAVIVESRSPPRWRNTFRRYSLSVACSKLLRRAFLVCIGDTRQRIRALQNVLGKQHTSGFHTATNILRVENVNSAEVVRFLGAEPPYALLVYGTGIVSEQILSTAFGRALNMHTGISPYYRGSACAFWPLFYEEPDKLGATVHECTSRVDGGEVYATRPASLQCQDGLHEAFARCVVTGVELYLGAIQELLSGCLSGKPQNLELGREFRAFMQTFGAELKVRRLIRNGLIAKYVRSLPSGD